MLSIDSLKGDYDTGWLVARNHYRVLNHLPLLQNYSNVAEQLYLSYECSNKEIVSDNFKILHKHQAGIISTQEAIIQLHNKLKLYDRVITIDTIVSLLRNIFSVPHIEFHPTDKCNLSCRGCTYGHDCIKRQNRKDVFPFDFLYKLKEISPKSIVIVGGGEPTLYRFKDTRFNELILKIRELLPLVQLGLITNGTVFLKGDWYKEFLWARISLDAATRETFNNFRQRDLFDKVCHNLLSYLNTIIPYTGIGFLYSKMNIFEYVAVIEFLYAFIKNNAPEALKKFNIQFRPLRQDPKDKNKDFPEAISPKDIDNTIDSLLRLVSSSEEIFHFVKYQTNAETVEGGNTHKPLNFSRCHYSLIFHILRANGNLYPCFITVDQPEFCLGNVIRDLPETIALNTLYIAGKLHDICNPVQCRQCHINNILEKGLKGELRPPASKEIQENFFF